MQEQAKAILEKENEYKVQQKQKEKENMERLLKARREKLQRIQAMKIAGESL